MEINARDYLIYFSRKYQGNWEKIYEAIDKKEMATKEEIQAAKEKSKYKEITLLDDDYPECLKDMYRPPFVLFYDGDLSLIKDYNNNIAFVGAREPSEYGTKYLKKLIKDIAKEFNVVSGGALGVDVLSHEEAMRDGGRTICVLGSGIDENYPKTNSHIINQIRKSGLVISEYPEGTSPKPENFPIRNRIVVGLSKSVIVFDMREQSGTQCTASLACQNNRNLLSIPYPLDTEFTNNKLIKEGCYLIENGDDIRFLMGNFNYPKK